MRRLIVLLALACFAIAQVNDVDNPRSGMEISAADNTAETAPSATDNSFLDDIIGSDTIAQPPANAKPVPATAANQPAEQEESSSPALQPADQEEPSASEPVQTTQQPSYAPSASGPDIDEPIGKPAQKTREINRSDRSSSSPNIDEAAVQETPDIPLFSHKAHIEDVGAECVQCHQTLFSESVRGIKSGPSMKEICSQCHNGTDAPAEVLAGFSNEKKYVKTHLPRFSHLKHMQQTEDCRVCHRDIYGEMKKIKTPPPMSLCSECHNNNRANANCRVCHEDPSKLQPKSHTPRWVYRNGHGTDARYNQAQCRECHADRECNACHKGQSSFAVHRPGYKFTHGMDARQRITNCSYCHESTNSCARCHERTR